MFSISTCIPDTCSGHLSLMKSSDTNCLSFIIVHSKSGSHLQEKELAFPIPSSGSGTYLDVSHVTAKTGSKFKNQL